ncbi:MAG: sporulation protein YabP [Clostridia bacterium]|nr:sporulation protein YabP [Clostridia bacterium]
MAQSENIRAAGRDHTVCINGRESIAVTGVCEVVSFDENSVVMETVAGTLTVDGTEMNVTGLDLANGQVNVTGKLVGLYYIEQRGKRRLFGR